MAEKDRIGFIGIGRIGIHIATNLQKHLKQQNKQLVVWNRTISKADPLIALGAHVATSLEDIVDKADVIFVSMSNDEAVIEIFDKIYAVHEFGKGRKLTTEQPLILLDTSTIYPTVANDLEKRSQKVQHRHYLSMPVFGATPAAEAALLVVVTAGDEIIKKRVQPLLTGVIGRAIIDVGSDVRSGATMKLIGNFFIFGVVELLSEGMTLADKSAVGQAKLMEFIELFFPAVPFKVYGGKMLNDIYDKNVGFSVELCMKDVRHILRLAETHDVSLPTAQTAFRHLQTVRAYGGQDYDCAALSAALRVQANLPPFTKDAAAVKAHIAELEKKGIL